MSASFNSVVLLGNLTRNPESRQLSSGTSVGEIGLAVNESFKDSSGEWQEKPVFVNVTVWGKTAENCKKFLSKGSSVLVDGRLQLDQWETDSGEKRSKLKVVASSVQFLGGGTSRATSGERKIAEPHTSAPAAENDDDVLPF